MAPIELAASVGDAVAAMFLFNQIIKTDSYTVQDIVLLVVRACVFAHWS